MPARSALPVRLTALAAAVSGVALSLVSAPGAGAVAPKAPSAAVLKVGYTVKERRAALAYWTPARMKAVGKSVDLGPTGPKSRPWRGAAMKTVGRLFFVNAGGADTWCTATSVNGANRSVVMAAGHCVRRPASPVNTYVDMVFVPGYSKGKRPYGAFAVRATFTPRTWAEEGVNDVAALAVDADAQGRALADVVGGQRIAFHRRVGGNTVAFGYPATRPQRGEELLHCTGTAKPAPGNEQAVPCDLGGGASGGPWLTDFDRATGKGVLVSVNSHGDGLETGTHMYGPVLGATAEAAYQQAQHG
ncbi:trypsin-like serine peptidase [Streptomyces endophytica]|uniref:Peptidase n=1 Tax=Streptomyces endophytica TaxID=2991496 RepID=A0ABY6PG16_9ACTN|nr:peptidase [Streptomyces endophytica]UZJ32818.1 peptidase [Streptomyces endophytica]